jgi:hypothetical protein
MLIEMTKNARGHVRATLRLVKPIEMEIEIEITPSGVNRAADRAVMDVCKILDGLRFCGISSCDCAACSWHQVIAVIRHCQRHAQFSSCEVSAVMLRGDAVQDVDEAFPMAWISLDAGEPLNANSLTLRTAHGAHAVSHTVSIATETPSPEEVHNEGSARGRFLSSI